MNIWTILQTITISVVVGAFLVTTPALLFLGLTFSPMLGFISTAVGFGLLSVYNWYKRNF